MALLIGLMPIVAPIASAQIVRSGATTLLLYNSSNQDVVVTVQVSGLPCAAPCVQSDGCPTGTVTPINYVDITANGQPTALTQFTAPTKGWFTLKRGHTAQIINMGTNPITKQVSSCLQGVIIGFGQFGNSCPDFGGAGTTFPNTQTGSKFNQPLSPTVPLPNGSNSFEATINLPGTVNGSTTVPNPSGGAAINAPTNESIDISCVNGANSTLVGQITPPAGGPFWVANLGTNGGGLKTYTSTVSFQNSWVDITHKCDNNCVDPTTGLARPGVFPYGCTQCNRLPDPAPPCTSGPSGTAQFCAAKNGLAPNNGCGFNRGPAVANVQKFGGTIQVTYMGPLSPPGTCK
jgi:hypothetical protein